MGQLLHGSATTTEAVGRAIQRSEESVRALAKRHGVNRKAVAKWKKRTSTADLPAGPKDPGSTSLSIEEEAVVVAFRRHTLLSLDDCLYALQATIPHLTRSALQRHGISRLPDMTDDKPAKRWFDVPRHPVSLLIPKDQPVKHSHDRLCSSMVRSRRGGMAEPGSSPQLSSHEQNQALATSSCSRL